MADRADDDLLIVLLCELGERLIAWRELLSAPSVAAKPHARAVAVLLGQGLDGVEQHMQRGVFERGAVDMARALRAVDECGRALRVLHRRLGLLDMRWSAAPVDIFLRKLRDDAGDLPHPAVVLSDDGAALDDDVAERLRAGLADAGVKLPAASDTPESPAGHATAGASAGADAVIALPRLEVSNPLAWPLLLPALARLHLHQRNVAGRLHGTSGVEHLEEVAVARLGGPAAFAARAAYALVATPPQAPLWPALAPLAAAAVSCAGGLEEGAAMAPGFGGSGSVGLFARLARARDGIMGHEIAEGGAGAPDVGPFADVALPDPQLPTPAETAALLDKLVAGTPINAVEPPLPEGFVARLEAVGDPGEFYALIEPLGERPASLAAILGVGWLYKVRESYPLFGELLRAECALRPALTAYAPHMRERNELLLQSIEAAHVQGIFQRGRPDA